MSLFTCEGDKAGPGCDLLREETKFRVNPLYITHYSSWVRLSHKLEGDIMKTMI